MILPTTLLTACLLASHAGLDPKPLLVQLALLWAAFGGLSAYAKRQERTKR